jgi:hypothetical protein
VGSDSDIDIPGSRFMSETGDWTLKQISPDKTFFDFEEFDLSYAGGLKFN